MFVLSKRNLILPGPAGTEPVRLRRDELKEIPDWAGKTDYFRALVADGKLVVTGKSDKSVQAAEDAAVTVRRGDKATKEKKD